LPHLWGQSLTLTLESSHLGFNLWDPARAGIRRELMERLEVWQRVPAVIGKLCGMAFQAMVLTHGQDARATVQHSPPNFAAVISATFLTMPSKSLDLMM